MARSASVLTAQEAKLLAEISEHGKLVSITSPVGQAVALRRLESKGMVEKIPVPTFQLSRLGQHALAFNKEVDDYRKSSGKKKQPNVPQNEHPNAGS
jgi:hypothetical protein